MNDTYVTVVGNLVTDPELRNLESNGVPVAHFRMGSTARRWDKSSGGWIDGNSLFVNVNCWRNLAENVSRSLFKGDPVVVTGRLYSREYTGDDGLRRVAFDLEAAAIGHNLARGTSTFRRVRSVQPIEAAAEEVAMAGGNGHGGPIVGTESLGVPEGIDSASDCLTERSLEPVGAAAN
jgi:single-strand DNA-binding protein